MAAPRKPAGTTGTRVYVATQSFSTVDKDGHPVLVVAGQRVREGHPILKGREASFKLDDTVWEVPTKE